jgi:FkbM family methyltransferase
MSGDNHQIDEVKVENAGVIRSVWRWLWHSNAAKMIRSASLLGWRGAVTCKLMELTGVELRKNGQIVRLWPKQPLPQPIYARWGTSDVVCFKCIFHWDDMRGLEIGEDVRWVIDAGANVGYASVWLAHRYPKATVIAIEPDPENFSMLLRNTSGLKDRIRCLHAGLWGTECRMIMSMNTFRDGGAWSKQAVAITGEDKETPPAVSVPCVTLDGIMKTYGISRIDLLKIDIEGAEVNVFQAGGDWVEATSSLLAELHDDTGYGSAHEAFRALTQDRFEVLPVGEKWLAITRKLIPTT